MLAPKFSAREVMLGNAVARWLGGFRTGVRLETLAGGPVRVRVGRGPLRDPHLAGATVRVDGISVPVAASGMVIRAIAQRVLGGPPELDAPRPLTAAERTVFAVVVAAALEDLGVPGEVWPVLDDVVAGDGLVLDVELAGRAMTVVVDVPADLVARAKPRLGAWVDTTAFELVVAVARCALPREAVDHLAVGDVVTVEAACRNPDTPELVFADGGVGLRAIPGQVVATVATEYVARHMALPDDAHLELTVALGTTRLSVRQLSELAIGQVVTLGRPIGGPYELRAGGRVIGRGELVDVEGELAVRIVSLGDSS